MGKGVTLDGQKGTKISIGHMQVDASTVVNHLDVSFCLLVLHAVVCAIRLRHSCQRADER